MTQSTLNDSDANAAQDATQFVPLRSVFGLDELVERSAIEPVVVFQHDPYCPISGGAYREILGLPVQVALVHVAQDQHLSRTIEQRTGVRHASPQVLVFRSGKVVWNASHRKITRRAVLRTLQGASTDSIGEFEQPHCGITCGSRPTPKDGARTSATVLSWLRSLWDHQ